MVFRILAERNPSKFGHFWRFSDEIHLFLDFILQRHYLEFYQSCFAESFYGLERKFEQNSDKRRSIRRSLILAVFVPYAKLKCDRIFEKIRTLNFEFSKIVTKFDSKISRRSWMISRILTDIVKLEMKWRQQPCPVVDLHTFLSSHKAFRSFVAVLKILLLQNPRHCLSHY